MLLGVLVGCSGPKLEQASELTPEADEHGELLYDGYLKLSEAEYNEGDYKDSDYFAELAMMAGTGDKFEPQHINDRDLPADSLNDAAAARRQLVVALYNGAAQKYPRESASAQLGFDCWMQEKEEDFQTADIATCRQEFQMAITRLGVKMTEKVDVPEPSEDSRLVFDVFFDFDSDKVSDLGQTHVAIISSIIAGFKSPVVSVVGNADQAGATNYNYDLAERRAENVAQILKDNGVAIDGVFNHADQAPKVDKPDRSPERLNRRVAIVVREAE
jgi:outer membrane protein OmpA-like peptidoglycan-associated protein